MNYLELQNHECAATVGQPVRPEDALGWQEIMPNTTVTCGGKPVLVYGYLADEPSGAFAVEQACRLVEYSRNPRMTQASGKRGRGGRIISHDTKFGYRPQRPVYGLPAGPCEFNSKYPGHYAALQRMAAWLQMEYQIRNPEKFGHHVESMAGVRPDCRINGVESIFTQGVMNKANILPYHYDSGNFPGTWSAMVYFTAGMQGGNLFLPSLRAQLVVHTHTYVLFDGQGTLHGVQPAVGVRPGAYRYSLVFYALQLMRRVGSQQEQLEKIRRSDMVKHKKALGKPLA